MPLKRNTIIFTAAFLTICLCSVLAVRNIVPASLSHQQAAGKPVLILDAGHGGEDGGAVSPAGDKESDINLAIVLKTQYLMAFLGVETILTRDRDISIYDEDCKTLREKKVSDLKNRVEMVQNTPGAYLLSVHQNSFTDSRYHGTQVFYGSGEQSIQWGEYTQYLFRNALDPSNKRTTKTIPNHVYLFQHIDCPSILVECGFLSNGTEASLLLLDTYQRKIALVLAGAYIHQLQMTPDPLGGD